MPVVEPPAALGSRVDGSTTVFRVRSGTSSRVDLCLLDADPARSTGSLSERRIEMRRSAEAVDVWEVVVPAPPGTRYGFRAYGGWAPTLGLRANPAKLLLDPYAHAVDLPPEDAFPAREELVDHTADDPHRPDERDSAPVAPWSVVVAAPPPAPSTRPEVPMGRTVVYEAHLGHLTRRHPAVPEADRGTFAGLTSPAVLDHLLGLGVTTVELLPVHQFASEPALVRRGARNAWGYNTLGYLAPHAAYCRSTDPHEQQTEVADAVRALHAVGLEVVLDVVFNHTAEGPLGGPTYHLRGLDNAAYYRLDPHDRSRYVDWTGCGNTLDAASPAVADLVLTSLRHWADRFDVDGYRFDLAPTLGREDADFDPAARLLRQIADDPVLGRLKLIAEPWDLGPNGYRLGGFTGDTAGGRWAEWNDRFRDDLRSTWRPGTGDLRPFGHAFAGSARVFQPSGRRPWSSVNYVTAHDGFSLRDVVSYDAKHNDANGEDNRDGTDANRSWNGGHEGPGAEEQVERMRLRRQAGLLATLLLSLGTPMLLAGDELGRTQSGNNNAYCLDDESVWLDWTPTPMSRALTALVRDLVALRREHVLLDSSSWLHGIHVHDTPPDVRWLDERGHDLSHDGWHDAGRDVIGVLLTAPPAAGGAGRSLLLWLNRGASPVAVHAPGEPGGWTVRIDTAAAVDARRADGPARATHDSALPFDVAGYGVLALSR